MTALTLHRGANRIAPENTLAAARGAIEYGADFVEVDVRTSADGTLYVLHDETVDRTTDGTGRLRDLPDAEVDRLDAGGWFGPAFAAERVPRLEAYLAAVVPHIGVYLDVKDGDPLVLAGVLASSGKCGRFYVLSEDEALSRALRRALPDVPHMGQLREAGTAAAVREAGFLIVELVASELTSENVSDARAQGLKIQVWHPGDDLDFFRRIRALGVDYANIDHPETWARSGQ